MQSHSPALRLALWVSALTHPLFMPVVGFVMMNHYGLAPLPAYAFWWMLLVQVVILIGLPSYFIFALKRSGRIQTYHMHTLAERRLPLMLTSAVMVFHYYMMLHPALPDPWPAYFLSLCITSLLAFLLSLFYKVSLHMIGMGFLFGLGIILGMYGDSDLRPYLMIISIISSAVAASRLLLRAHTRAQLALGFLTGLGCACSLWPALN